MSDCYHCGLPVSAGAKYAVAIDGETRPMCCPGCQAVAGAIVDGGLGNFYRYRSANAVTPREASPDYLAHYDLPEIQEEFVHRHDDGTIAADLAITGITCSACAWLIEHHLARLPGVASVTVNVSSHRGRIRWEPDKVALSRVLGVFDEIGYEARPAGDVENERRRDRENKRVLLRLGVAGLGMMQAGMVAVALYAGGFSGIESQWQQYLRWVSLIIVTPVVFYSARPFFQAALRSLKVGRLVMDVPVALAITLAYAASIWATLTNSGEVYFDSISMFTFFLLLGRYLEMRVRHRNENYAAGLSQLVPAVAIRLTEGGEQAVPVKSLCSGDHILIPSGHTIPCDGEVVDGDSEVVEAVLTGEQRPVLKGPGHPVSAGTVNVDNPLRVRVLATGKRTRLAAILDLVEEARSLKPRRAAIADRLSGYFVAAVLVIAVGVFAAWMVVDSSRALWVTLSVLVVTCPCALSLATPAALTVATGELKKQGFLIRKAHVLETLARLSHAIFDKTGTLTAGRMEIAAVRPAPGVDSDALLALATALERGFSHPIARVFQRRGGRRQEATGQRMIPAQGVVGAIDGVEYAFGSPRLLKERFGHRGDIVADERGVWLTLGSAERYLGSIQLVDEVREGAAAAVVALRELGVEVELLSGDRPETTGSMARQLGIDHWQGGAAPADKLEHLRSLQKRGGQVMMVGDGINDVPVLSGADVSVAMGDAVELTRLHADSLLVSPTLGVLPGAIALARKTGNIIRQNLAWALGYNLLALPLAATGFIPPWAAAIGMSFSSLLVVLNALRLAAKGPAAARTGG